MWLFLIRVDVCGENLLLLDPAHLSSIPLDFGAILFEVLQFFLRFFLMTLVEFS